MKNPTKLPARSAVSILSEIESGTFQKWSIATKALNVDSLELSKGICLRMLSDGDTDCAVRLELAYHHERIQKALFLLGNQSAIVPYQYTEVKYPQKQEITIDNTNSPNYALWAYLGISLLLLFIYLMS